VGELLPARHMPCRHVRRRSPDLGGKIPITLMKISVSHSVPEKKLLESGVKTTLSKVLQVQRMGCNLLGTACVSEVPMPPDGKPPFLSGD